MRSWFQFVRADWNRELTRSHTKVLLAVFFSLSFVINSFAQARPADLVVINANIHTIASRDSVAQALAVNGNRISVVGSNAQIKNRIGPETRVIDARGRLVLPGFNDAHVHFTAIGNTFSSLDLRGATGPQDVIARVERYASFLPAGRWILGSGLADNLLPTLASLDAASPRNPFFVYQPDGRSALANSAALTKAGVKGETTGIARGVAMQRIASVVPRDHTSNWSEIAETATNYAASLGVTSVQDMHSDDSRAIYLALQKNGKLKTRVYDCLALRDWKKLADTRLPRSGGDMVRDGCLKGFSDGDPAEADGLRKEIEAGDKAGLQVMIHAIGKSANAIALEAFENVIRTNGARDRRFRAEHAHDPSAADVPRFARSSIIASMQPFLFENGNGEYYATLLKQNAHVAFGSDASIVDMNPLLGIHAAVNAKTEAISVYDAVRAYTLGSAFAEFQEAEKGTIERGKLADFVILSDDIFSIDRLRIRGVRVVRTIVDGREVYGSDGK